MVRHGGMLIGVMLGALVLVGCSREPEQDTGTAMATQDLSELGKDLSQVAGDSAPSSSTVECLMASLNNNREGIDEVLQQPREPVAAAIPPNELVYWGRTKTDAPVFAARCLGALENASQAELASNPFGVFNAVTHLRQAASMTFQPTPKGDFEKTVDYEARLAREKAEFDKANSGKKITNYDIEHVWMGLFGSPKIKDDGSSEQELYNPDTETLSLTIVPQAFFAGEGSHISPSDMQRPFEIPVRIRLTPEQAQRFFKEYPMSLIVRLRPAVIMQMRGGVLTVKEISIKDEYPDKFQRLGFGLDNLVMNVELSRDFLPTR